MTERLRIAAADDEIDMREYFKRVLPRLGYNVVSVASTGQELVQHCRALRPDLVITDVKMPVMDGIEAVKQLSNENPTPVILVSAYHDPQLVSADLNRIMACIVKPIKRADWEPAITSAMRSFRDLRQFGSLPLVGRSGEGASVDRGHLSTHLISLSDSPG